MTSPFPGISRCDVENVRRVAQNILGEDVQHIENIDTEENKNVRRVAQTGNTDILDRYFEGRGRKQHIDPGKRRSSHST